MFSLHLHADTPHISTNVHVPEEHATSIDSAIKNTSHLSITPGAAFESSGASGQSTGLLASFQPVPIKLQGDSAANYFVMPGQRANAPHQVYTISENGLKQTSKLAVQDSRGHWKLDNGLPGGGKKSGGYTPLQDYSSALSSVQSSPFARHSSQGASGNHSFSNQSAWNNPSTASSNAPPIPPKSSSLASGAVNAAPPLPPKSGDSASRPSFPSETAPLPYDGYGPQPDDRYLKESGDGKSKNWVIEDGRGGTKPADSSLDKYGQPIFVNLKTGKGTWTGPHASVIPPPKHREG